MIRYIVSRKDGIFVIYLMPQKGKSKWQFVNMSKEHICPCVFDSIEDAEKDLASQKKVLNWRRLDDLNGKTI